MARQSEQFEREADETRARLAVTIAELRAQMTPGQIFDQVFHYASEGSAAEFFKNLGREIREHPLPLVLIGIGIAWLMVGSSRSARTVIANTSESASKKAAQIGAMTSDVTNRVADSTRDLAGAMGDKVRSATWTATGVVVPFAGEPERTVPCDNAQDRANEQVPISEGVALSGTAHQSEIHSEHGHHVVEPAHERR